MCTGTCGGSETSLNTVVHQSVRIYMNEYVKISGAGSASEERYFGT